MKNHLYKKGLHQGIAVALGYFAVAFTFGMSAAANGLTTLQSALISLTNVTSAGQFAGLAIIAADGTCLELALSQLVINLRYCLMSFSLAQKLQPDTPLWHRFIMAHGVTDEIFALDSVQAGRLQPIFHYGVMSIAIPGWVLGTLAGAISGSLLPAFIMSALGIAIYSMFLAIIIPPAKKSRTLLLVVLCAMGLSLLFAVVPYLKKVSSGFVIIITTILTAGIAAKLKPIDSEPIDNEEGEQK